MVVIDPALPLALLRALFGNSWHSLYSVAPFISSIVRSPATILRMFARPSTRSVGNGSSLHLD